MFPSRLFSLITPEVWSPPFAVTQNPFSFGHPAEDAKCKKKSCTKQRRSICHLFYADHFLHSAFFLFQQTGLCSSVRMALPCPLVGSTAYRGSSSSTQAFGACHRVHRKAHRSNVCKGKPQRSKTAGVKHIELMREARCNAAPAIVTVVVSL